MRLARFAQQKAGARILALPGMSLIAIAVVVFLAASCSDQSGERSTSNALNRGLLGSPESFDPHRYASSQAGSVLRDIGEGLLSYTADGRLTGGVASNWQVGSEGLEYTFYLRADAKWSNGEPVTANDFVYAFRRLVTPETASQRAANLSIIKNVAAVLKDELPPGEIGVRAPDNLTLKILLESPTPYFLQLLTSPTTFPVYAPGVEQYGDKFARPGTYITNGAYTLAERSVASSITLARNPHYWDNDHTSFDEVVYHVVEAAAEMSRYRAGELDVTGGVDSGVFEKMQKERPDELRVAPFLGVYYYGFNLTKEPFKSSLQLRQALSLAIDRSVLVQAVTRRGEAPAFGWVPPGIDNYESQSDPSLLLGQAAREKEAVRLYKAAGYGPDNPLKFELRYNTLGGHQQIALAIQSMWRDVLGADATLVNEEFKVFLSNVQAMEVTQVFWLSWTGDYNDAQTFLQLLDSSNASNLTAFANDRVDELLASAAVEVDLGKRRTILEEAERVALSEYPVIPIYFYVSKHLLQPDIQGWESNILDYHYSKHLSRSAD